MDHPKRRSPTEWGVGLAARISQGLSSSRQVMGQVGEALSHKAREIETDLRARREADVAGMVAGLRARLAEQLPLTPLPIDADLQEKAAPLGLGRVRTEAWQGGRLRKVVLSHIELRPVGLPVIEGFALTLLPTQDADYPCFFADLMALPLRVSVNADVYGRDWQTQGVLAALRPTFFRLGSSGPPKWVGKHGSGQGLHAKLRPAQVEEGFGALLQGMAAYLGGLADPPPGRSTEAQEQIFYLFHQNGPRQRLARIFGEPWAERYSRLLFE